MNGQDGGSSGTHLIWKQVSNNTVTVDSAMYQAGAVTASGGARVILDSSFAAAPDTRSVHLTRDGAHNETWDADGTGHGDTTFSYFQADHTDDPPSTTEVLTWQYFQATFEGGWHTAWDSDYSSYLPYVSWAWSPDCTGDRKLDGRWSMLDGTRVRNIYLLQDADWTGAVDSPVMRTISYSATDNVDGAKCTARYVLTMHDPVEPVVSADVETHPTENWRYHPNAIWGINSTQYATDVTLGVTDGYSWTLGVALSGEIAKWAAAVFGIDFHVDYTITAEASVEVVAHEVPPGYMVKLQIGDVYEQHDGVSNTYDAGGPTGQQAYTVKKPDGRGIRPGPYVVGP